MNIKKRSDLESLELIHIFEYYDFPLFFISKDPTEKLYLNYYIEESEENIDKWLFSRISVTECKNLMEQRISVLDLLNKLNQRERLFHLFIDSSKTEPDMELNIEVVDANNFDYESFPEEDFYVEYDYVTNEKLTKVEEEILDSKFKLVLKDFQNSHDIGLDFLLDIFENFKKTMNEIAKDVGRSIVGDECSSEKINLRVDSLQPSSFGVWLKTESDDMFDVPEKLLSHLFEIIQNITTKNKKEIEELIFLDESYSIESIKSLKNMLTKVSDNNYTFKLEGNTKYNDDTKVVTFGEESYEKLDVLVNILQENSTSTSECIEVEGELTSVNIAYNQFRVSTTSIGDIKGKISPELFSDLKNKNIQFRVPSVIKARIRKEMITDLVEDTTKIKYELMSYIQPEE
ncbi:DUF6575 domain-containing protein [Bacillus altitudinis]|uniref:DUF6575 domain-containing protein n=1 Tax=Bacillus altitudinis TaxID=293387 RepID=UPI001BA69156|nr:DUF6575 domain-containing protein [Bacillus altitudinis]MBR0630737.1 hypothetical protein [Bacillus altitudinis C101]